ncbi:MAG: sodium pump decarboxylase gamma subunit [Desulforhopalus sp.]|jgi:sodium pump decarboxylase gamma subunit
MDTTELLATFANSDLIHSLSFGDKISAGLITTVLGMGITFSALVILLFIITGMNKFLSKTPTPSAAPAKAQPHKQSSVTPHTQSKTENDNEIVAAITTAIAMSLKTSASNIVIRNIERIDNRSPQWNKAGIIEQMNNRL